MTVVKERRQDDRVDTIVRNGVFDEQVRSVLVAGRECGVLVGGGEAADVRPVRRGIIDAFEVVGLN